MEERKGSMTDYEWLTSMGLCHKCRKEKVAKGHVHCLNCLDRIKEESRKYYDPEKARKYQERRRKIYREKKMAGICVRCKKTATHGMFCYEHSIKAKRRSQERAQKSRNDRIDRGLVPEIRKKNGLCLWCGKPAMRGKYCCEEHSRVFSEAGKKAAAEDKGVKEFWKLIKSKHSGNT